MKLENDEVLRSFAGMANCESCGKYLPVCGHHYWIRRSQCRIDHPFNLVGLCVHCHDHVHNPGPGETEVFRLRFLQIAAVRENVSQGTIREFLIWIKMQDKGRSVGSNR